MLENLDLSAEEAEKKAELAEFKRKQKQMLDESYQAQFSELKNTEKTEEKEPVESVNELVLSVDAGRCFACNGTGQYKGLLLREECKVCYGTGFKVDSLEEAVAALNKVIAENSLMKNKLRALQADFDTLKGWYGKDNYERRIQEELVRGKPHDRLKFD
jgi:mannitol-specific phosphotransferase system IIBC component